VYYGIGNAGQPNPAGAFIEVLEDGSVQLLTGCADIGQGSDTILVQIAAEELGVKLADIALISGDTAVTPEAGRTSASRQTYVSGNAVRLAAKEAKETLIKEASILMGVPKKLITIEEGVVKCIGYPNKKISIKELARHCRKLGVLPMGKGWFNPPNMPLDPETGQGVPFATYGFGTQIAEVEVDSETGEVEVKKIYTSYDVGKAINPLNIEGQVDGGVSMGLGDALMEEVIIEEGISKTDSFTNYLLPTSMDVPEISTTLVEEEEPTGPFGAKGVGEHASIPTAAAIANAVYDAIGVQIKELPITAEVVWRALQKAEL